MSKLRPLISIGSVHVTPWSVDWLKKIGLTARIPSGPSADSCSGPYRVHVR